MAPTVSLSPDGAARSCGYGPPPSAVGAYTWLSGQSSGKLFLDWSGYARIFFPLAMIALWLLLVVSFVRGWNEAPGAVNARLAARSAKIFGLVLLLAVPVLIYIASSPGLYPAVNPDTGGPTGASQLESSLIIVAILLMLPFGLTRRKAGHSRTIAVAWAILVAEFILCFALGRTDISHHRPAQFLSLGSLLIWLPLTPAYYAAFEWRPGTRRWRIAFLAWWSALVLTGWVLFLPGVLDHFKFTDGLVGHSLLAMAGFTSSLLIFVMVQLLGRDGWIFNRSRSFYGWNGAVLAYVVLMLAAGWREGFDPAFTIVAGPSRNASLHPSPAGRGGDPCLLSRLVHRRLDIASRIQPGSHQPSAGGDGMNRPILIGYQALIGLSDTFTGALLMVAPELALRLLRLHAPADALPFLSFIGAFVLSVGLACLYGALVMVRRGSPCKLEVVWLLTAITRASVAIFVVTQILAHTLELGWLGVAVFDSACVLIQAAGLRRGWLVHAAR